MTLPAGTKLGPCEIVAPVGAGTNRDRRRRGEWLSGVEGPGSVPLGLGSSFANQPRTYVRG
jgi:hypothetical protein